VNGNSLYSDLSKKEHRCCFVVAAAAAAIIMWKVWKHVRVHHDVLGMENTWESLEERFSNQDLCHDQ